MTLPHARDLRIITVCGVSALGGSETFFVTLSQGLTQAGASVHCTLRHNTVREAALRASGIGFDVLPYFRRFDPITPMRFRRIARKFQPDAVLTITGRGAAMTPPGHYALIGRLGGYYKYSYFRRCDYLVCNTPDIVRFVRKGGWDADKVFYIPNFPHIDNLPALDRRTLDTPEGVPLAIALGRLHSDKAFDILLKSCANIPDLWLWIAGTGSDETMLRDLARDLKIDHRVKFLGWRTDRGALFRAADLCVFPSREEPMGNVVLEAWAYGVPLVTAASVGPAWLTRHGDDALIVPIDDVPALSEAIRAVLNSKSLAETLVRNGLARIDEEFSKDAVINQYIELFRKVRPAARA